MPASIEVIPAYLGGLEGTEVLSMAIAIDHECQSELDVFASLAAQTSESMWRIGCFAEQMKSLLPHGNYEAWQSEVATKIRKSVSSIRDYRQVAQKFPAFDRVAAYMPISAAVELARDNVTDSVRDEAIALAESGSVVDLATARQLKSAESADLEKGDRVFCNGSDTVSGEFMRYEGDRAVVKLDDGAFETYSRDVVCPATVQPEKPKTKRIKNDYYPTPDGIVQHLLANVAIDGRILEPCAGHGAIAQHFDNCITNEPFPADGFEATYNMDATDPVFWEAIDLDGGVDWVITNPPYGLSTPIVEAALTHARVGVAMLLRINWLEPCADRAHILQEYAPQMSHIIWFNPRPQFRRDIKATDNVTVAWVVWRKAHKRWCKNVFVNDWK